MKLAFVGVENSHAPAFLQLIKNNPDKYADIEVAGVYSYDGAAADKLVADGLAPMAARIYGAFLNGACILFMHRLVATASRLAGAVREIGDGLCGALLLSLRHLSTSSRGIAAAGHYR